MTYICYIRTRSSDVDHMEVLPHETLGLARQTVLAMLADRPQASFAEIYSGDSLVERLERESSSSAA